MKKLLNNFLCGGAVAANQLEGAWNVWGIREQGFFIRKTVTLK